jgi:hypothetical protein
MAKQVTQITLRRILMLMKHHEKIEHPHKVTFEIRTDHSGCIKDMVNQNLAVWNTLDELNDLIVEAGYE